MKVKCQVCGKKIEVKDNQQKVMCPKCKSTMRWTNIDYMITD